MTDAPTLPADYVERLREAALKATPGLWRREALGGDSTVIVGSPPRRNERPVTAYAYDESRGYCLAYPFREAQGVRLDFVCFSHEDATFIARANPAAILALLAERDAAVGALEKAEQFITNGVELGFIRMPDSDTPDPAHETLPAIRQALRTLQPKGEQS